MSTNDLLQDFASELSSRLEQFSFKKLPIAIGSDGKERSCTITRLKIAGARANVFAFQGPYLEGEHALWAGFGSRSAEAIDLLQASAEPNTRFCSIGYDDWEDYVLPPKTMRKLARSRDFAHEDYRGDTNWIWLGRYFRPHKAAASKAAAFIVPAARALLFGDNPDSPVGAGPTETEGETKRRLVQSAFRAAVARRAKGCCVVTGCTTPAALRASHILPWKENPKLRADPDNGLYLVGTLDALFDRGRISFDEKHRIMISDVIPVEEWKRLGLSKELRLEMKPMPRQEEFLRRHREYKFLKF